MGLTKIEWTDRVWNPITGCSPVSDGCRNCYARRMVNRLKGRYGYPKDDPFRVIFHPGRLNEPLHWKKPSRIFVGSMTDIFHDDVDGFWLSAIWSIIERAYWHIFLILTKRPERWGRLTPPLPLYKHLWLGVSVEDQKTADERIPILLQIPVAKRFVSYEPGLGPVDLRRINYTWLLQQTLRQATKNDSLVYEGQGYLNVLTGEWNDGEDSGPDGRKIDWVIAGGESGPGARPLHPDWVRSLRDQCQAAGVPFFFKSWGKIQKPQNDCYFFEKVGHLLDGKEYREFPNG